MQQSPSQSFTQPIVNRLLHSVYRRIFPENKGASNEGFNKQTSPHRATTSSYHKASSPGYIADAWNLRNSARRNEVPLTETGAYDVTPARWKSLETASNRNALRAPSTTQYPAETNKALTPVNAQAGQYVANLDRFLQDSITVPGQERRSAYAAKHLSQFIGDARRKNLQQSGYDTKGLFRNAANLTLPVTLGSNKRFSGSGYRTYSYRDLFSEHSPELRRFISTGNVPVNINKNTSEIGSHFDSGENPQVNLYRASELPKHYTNADKQSWYRYSDMPYNAPRGLPADQQTLQHELIHANHNSYAFPDVTTTDGRKSVLEGAFGIDRRSGENYTHSSEFEFLRSLRAAKEAYARHLLNTTDMSGELVAKTVQDPNKFREFLGQVYGDTALYDLTNVRIPSTAAQDRNEIEVYRAFHGLNPAYNRMLKGIPTSAPSTKEQPLAPDPREIYDKKTINSIFDTVWPQVNNTTSQGRGIDKMAALSPEKGASNEGFNKQASPLIDLITHAAPIYAAAKSLPVLKYGWQGLKHGLKMEHGGKLSRQLKNTASQGINWAARGAELLPNYLGNAFIRPAVTQARMWAVNAPTPVRKAINKAVTLRAAGANKLRGKDPHAYNPGKAVKHSLFDLITNQIPGAEAVRALFTRKFRNPADTSGYTLAMNDAMRRLYNS